VADLLGSLRAVGAHEQAAALLARNPAAHVLLNNSLDVGELLKTLRAVGARKQSAALIGRLPAAGLFGLFLFEQQGPADQFRFGREADGAPATPWGWEDLNLWPAPPSRKRRRRPSAQQGVRLWTADRTRRGAALRVTRPAETLSRKISPLNSPAAEV
jgi:hypothetical protein